MSELKNKSSEELAKNISDIDFELSVLKIKREELKKELEIRIENDKMDGSVSETFGDYKVTRKNNYNVTVDIKIYESLSPEIKSVVDSLGLIKTKQEVNKAKLKKAIENEEKGLTLIQNCLKSSESVTLKVEKLGDK